MHKAKQLSTAQIKCLEHARNGGISRNGKLRKAQLGVTGHVADLCIGALKKREFLRDDESITEAGLMALAQAQADSALAASTAS
jgi:hypothetical protein